MSTFGSGLWGAGPQAQATPVIPGAIPAQQIIYMVLRKCGHLRPGWVAQPELLLDILFDWGSMFDAWQAQRTMGFSLPQYQYTVNGPGSQQNGNGYLIGPTASQVGNANDFTGPRPESIVRANCVMLNTGPNPVYIPMRPIGAEEWASLSIRQIPAINVTSLFYYDPQYPNGVLNIFPPLIGNAIELFTWGALTAPTSLTGLYGAPPGYQDAVIWSLAERAWPLVTKAIAANKVSLMYLAGKAHEAREKISLVNRPIPTLRGDFRSGSKPAGYYDSFVSYTGEPY